MGGRARGRSRPHPAPRLFSLTVVDEQTTRPCHMHRTRPSDRPSNTQTKRTHTNTYHSTTPPGASAMIGAILNRWRGLGGRFPPLTLLLARHYPKSHCTTSTMYTLYYIDKVLLRERKIIEGAWRWRGVVSRGKGSGAVRGRGRGRCPARRMRGYRQTASPSRPGATGCLLFGGVWCLVLGAWCLKFGGFGAAG